MRRTFVVLATALAFATLAAAAHAATSTATGSRAPAAAGKLQSFRVTITFAQKRPWTYFHEQTSTSSPVCVRTEDRSGGDSVHVTASTSYAYRPGEKYGFGVIGTQSRTGAGISTVAGSECAPSMVFPSTWRIITQTAGSTSASEPHDGCGSKKLGPSYASIRVVGTKLWLRWDDTNQPDFKGCPYFDGSNEAQDGKGLPGASYLDVSAPISLGALKNASLRRITTSGTATVGETETCANLVQQCPEGVTYNATASVHATATFVLVRVRR